MPTIFSLINGIIIFINDYLVPLIFAIAFIMFLYGVFRGFIANGGNEAKRTEGRKFVVYGVIGFAIMLSVWGLVNLITNTFGFYSPTRPALPTFGGSDLPLDSYTP